MIKTPLRRTADRSGDQARSLRRSIAAGATAVTLAAAGAAHGQTTPAATPISTSQAQPTNNNAAQCALRYHAALGTEVLPLARKTQAAADTLRQPRPEMPGQWLFWDGSGVLARTAHQQRLMSVPLINWQANRLCSNQILARGGRIRCLKWEPIPEGYQQPEPKLPTSDPTTPEITDAERRMAGRLTRRVSRKGAFAEFAFNTPLYHVAQRTTDELIVYASQPYRPTLCSGAREMIDFYTRQLRPIEKLAADATRLNKATIPAASGALQAALGRPINTSDANPATIANLLNDVLDKALTDEERSTITTKTISVERLSEIREHLTDARFDALPELDAKRLRKALRNIEFRIYAHYTEENIWPLERSFKEALEKIRNLHAKKCVCE